MITIAGKNEVVANDNNFLHYYHDSWYFFFKSLGNFVFFNFWYFFAIKNSRVTWHDKKYIQHNNMLVGTLSVFNPFFFLWFKKEKFEKNFFLCENLHSFWNFILMCCSLFRVPGWHPRCGGNCMYLVSSVVCWCGIAAVMIMIVVWFGLSSNKCSSSL